MPKQHTIEEPTPLEKAHDDMRFALAQYSEKMTQYQCYLKTDENSGSPHAQLLHQDLEVARFNYYKARMAYEQINGDVERYQKKLQRFYSWSKEVNISCTTGIPFDQYETQSTLLAGTPS